MTAMSLVSNWLYDVQCRWTVASMSTSLSIDRRTRSVRTATRTAHITPSTLTTVTTTRTGWTDPVHWLCLRQRQTRGGRSTLDWHCTSQASSSPTGIATVSYVQGGPKKRATVLLFISSPVIDRFSKFAILWLLYTPPHREYVSTQLCEISMKYAYITITTKKHFGNKIMFIRTRSLSNAFRQFTAYGRIININSELFWLVEKKSSSLIANCIAATILSSFSVILT